MDNQPSRAGSGPGQPGARSMGLFGRLRVLDRILEWLTALFDLSDEQQDQAGIYAQPPEAQEPKWSWKVKPLPRPPLVVMAEEPLDREQLLANDSLGG